MRLDDLVDRRLGPIRRPFGEGSALILVEERSRISLDLNVAHRINELALGSPAVGRPIEDVGAGLVDSYYGQIYTGLPEPGSAVYGETAGMPYQAFDERAEGHLRVPFKRIPRVPVRSRSEIAEVVGTLQRLHGGGQLLFRGQCREYALARSPRERELLYGDAAAVEPSLLASASRRHPSIEDCMDEWMTWVQLCQLANLNQLRNATSGLRRQALDHFMSEIEPQWTNEPFYYFCLALAQHYGLSSVGLDVTDRLETALFFALTKLQRDAPGRLRANRVAPDAEHPPVLYVLLPEGSREFSYAQTAHPIFHAGRPHCQNAWFLHVGWGLSRNAAARQILIALVLDPRLDYGSMPRPNELFPGPDEDFLARFLATIEPHGDALLQVLEDFYWVAD